jgi:2-acylglycerol O-acyltransferase 2
MPGDIDTMSATPPRSDDPPKSYAEVAVKPPPRTNGSEKHDPTPAHSLNEHVEPESSTPSPSDPSCLDDPPKSYAEAAIEPPPQTNGHQTNGTYAKSPGEYEGSGILDAPPLSPTRSSFRRPRTKDSRSSLKGKSMSTTSLNSEDTLYESYHHNGQLTSIKPTDDYEENLARDEKERKATSNGKASKGDQELQIASGRIAAEGWERSGSVFCFSALFVCANISTAYDGHR